VNTNQPTEENYAPHPPQPRSAPPSGTVPVTLPASSPRVTYTILGITVVVYLLQLLSQFIFGYDLVVNLGAKANDAIRAGQLWRFFTPMLLHGSILHIGFNMYALYIFGIGLERRYGHGRFLLIYILSGFAGAVFSFLFSSAYSIGASGAIFGLIGAEGIFLFQNRKLFGAQVRRALNNVIFVVAINLFLGLQPGIDNWGHVGGLMGGLIFAWFAGPHWEVQGITPNLQVVDRREPRDVIVGAAVVTIIFCTLAAIGMWFPIVK
jgi:rhomboid protease GluP